MPKILTFAFDAAGPVSGLGLFVVFEVVIVTITGRLLILVIVGHACKTMDGPGDLHGGGVGRMQAGSFAGGRGCW